MSPLRYLPLLALIALGGCSAPAATPPSTSDAATAGQALIVKLGCGSCHTIPGIVDANGMVGPPLAHIASRQYVAGMLRNTTTNMVHWLRFPQQVVPGNAMPDLAISEPDGEAIAAYLATLK